jgi:glutathione-regulated potassium-efflux system ancillary protein KefC
VDRFRAKEMADSFRRHNIASVNATLPFYQDEARRMSMAKSGREELEQQFARDRERFEQEHGGKGWK